MKIKNILILILCLLLSVTAITSCTKTNASDDEDVEMQVRDTIMNDFTKVVKIARDSGYENKISEYIINRAKNDNLEVKTDKAGNIIIEKEATEGYENEQTTILHSRMDMKTVYADDVVESDTEKKGIVPVIDKEKDEIKGSTTNLGVSSAMGIVTAFFVLENSANSGPLKAIFTTNGETDMSGAKGLSKKELNGAYLINLNGTDNKNIEIASSYTAILNATKSITRSKTSNKYAYVLVADKFLGGESGEGVKNGQANPIKILADILAEAKGEGLMYELSEFTAESDGNKIPTMAKTVITVNEYEKSRINRVFNKAKDKFESDFGGVEKDAELLLVETTLPQNTISTDDTNSLVSFLYGLPDGGYDNEIDASSSLNYINLHDKKVEIKTYIRGMSRKEMNTVINDQMSMSKISKIQIKKTNSIPGYNTKEDAVLPTLLSKVYKEQTGANPEETISEDASELGIFSRKNKDLQIVSIGPTISSQNTVAETLEISTLDIPAVAILNFLSEDTSTQGD